MSYVGAWAIDDVLTFVANTQVFATGVATDADSVPTYRVYEDETTTPLLTGSMALLDSVNTAGFYSEAITLSAANGFEKGKSYSIYIAATVSTVAGATHRTFQIQAAVDTRSVGGTAQTAGDIFARLGAPAGASMSADVAAVKVDTAAILVDTGTTLDGRIPAALVGGRIDASVGAMAANVVTAAAVAVDAIGASELAADAANEIADAILDRDMGTGTDSGSTTVRTPRQALRVLRNRAAIAAGTLTTYKEDDVTASWTAAVTTTAGNPISEVNPAGP